MLSRTEGEGLRNPDEAQPNIQCDTLQANVAIINKWICVHRTASNPVYAGYGF